jgi:hypothetical protein
LRASLYAQIRLPALVGAQIGIVSAQAKGLARGEDVTFTREQMVSFFPTSGLHPSLPADLTAHAFWTLSGDETLTGSD